MKNMQKIGGIAALDHTAALMMDIVQCFSGFSEWR
jgi:hypothetical protein